MNKGDWIMEQMDAYKKEPGSKAKLKEKNPKWINDDYVKFIRYGQGFIEKNKSGVLAFINPHGFLDNPTFRGMRYNLLKTYDKIYILDLHGNARKKESCPDGSPDDNVFDIMQGVSINIFIKTGKKKDSELGKIFLCDLFGKREDKYRFLEKNSIETLKFRELPNVAPMYYFVPKDYVAKKDYDKGFSLNKMFTICNTGAITSRYKFTIHKTAQIAKHTIETFLGMDDEAARAKFDLGKDARDWKVAFARKDLLNNYPEKDLFTKFTHLPFDDRYTYYTGTTKGFFSHPARQTLQHLLKGWNVGLVFSRGNSEHKSAPCMVSKNIIGFRSWGRPGSPSVDYIAPLYLYPEASAQPAIGGLETLSGHRLPNLDRGIVNKIANVLGLTFTEEKVQAKGSFAPIDILDYIYAVLHSPAYREKYKEFLKTDFPRVPYPEDNKSFWRLAALGGKLRKCHLMDTSNGFKCHTTYPENGDNTVGKIRWGTDGDGKGRVWVNDTQYFGQVPLVAWELYMGGYRPAQKWLKDRKETTLDCDDIEHYQKIITALAETVVLVGEIDLIKQNNK